jgi:hypothetical protein
VADGSVPVLEALLRFSLFAALALLLPGLALQRLARVRPDPALVLPVGALFCSVAYYVALRADEPLLFPLLTAATAVGFAVPGARSAAAAPGPSLRGAVVPFAVLVALFAATQYRVNRVAPDGSFLVDVGEHQDTALHVGLTFELVAGYPPQVPGPAGVPLRYHVGAHLVRAAAVRWAGVHPYDLLNRLEITLWAAGLVLALRAVAQALELGRAAVALAGFLPLAADLSFVPGLWLGAWYWAFKLGDSFVEAVFYANSIAPAMMLVLAAIVAFRRHERGEGRGWLVLAGALSGGVAQFKVFTGAQLLLAAATAWLVRRSRSLMALAVPAALAVLVLVLSSGGHGTAPPVVALEPLAPTNPAREAYGLAPATGLAFVVSGLAWIVLSLGLRAAGLPAAWRALRGGTAEGPGAADRRAAVASAGAVAGALALSGWPLALLVSIRADPDVDESFYFLQASGLVLWLFAAPALASLARRSVALAAVAAVVALLPAAEFVAHKSMQAPLVVPAASVRAMAALRAASCPGDVVLSRVRIAKVPLPVVLAGRRVALADYIGYWRQFTTLEALEARRALVREFFQARDPASAEAVAARLGAGYVHLHGAKAPVEETGALVPLFAEGDERVYRIDAEARAGSCRAGAR